MPLAYYRLGPSMVVRLIITVWTAFIVAYVPNYQKIAYQNTTPRDYRDYVDNAGYPAGRGYPEIQSVKEIQLYDNYVIEVDVKNLEQTHVYKDLQLHGTMSGGVWGRINRVLNNNLSDYGIGQYYVATLENGEKLLLFLDDTAISIPKSGRLLLPVGTTRRVKTNELFAEIQDKYQLPKGETIEYVDMAGGWRRDQAKDLEIIKALLLLGTMVGMIVLQVLIHVIYINALKRIPHSQDTIYQATENILEEKEDIRKYKNRGWIPGGTAMIGAGATVLVLVLALLMDSFNGGDYLSLIVLFVLSMLFLVPGILIVVWAKKNGKD